MATRYGVRNTGVQDGRKLRKVVGIEWQPDRPDQPDGPARYWEKLSCGHDGKPVGADGNYASQRWCNDCKDSGERLQGEGGA
jgi:hypothetical protein